MLGASVQQRFPAGVLAATRKTHSPPRVLCSARLTSFPLAHCFGERQKLLRWAARRESEEHCLTLVPAARAVTVQVSLEMEKSRL